MTIFHVSGSAASGKTWLGNLIRAIYKPARLRVVDLDDLFYRATDATRHMPPSAARAQHIEQHVRRRVAQICAAHSNVLLVGYSDLYVNGRIHYIDLGATVRYFIDITPDDLIRQFRSRNNRHILDSRGLPKNFTDADIRKMLAHDRRVYHNYRRMPQLMIVRDIVRHMDKK